MCLERENHLTTQRDAPAWKAQMFPEAEHLVISKQPLTTHTCSELTGFEVFWGFYRNPTVSRGLSVILPFD